MKHQLALILDFGSQYTQLIAKRIRNMHIYCEIVPFNIPFEEIMEKDPQAIIFSGSPFSVTNPEAPIPDERIFDLDLPMLGICYGMQLLTKINGGVVEKSDKKEYGYAKIHIEDFETIFKGLDKEEDVWMSHGDAVAKLADDFRMIAYSENSPYAAIAHKDRPVFALQFHPEVVNSKNGDKMLANFLKEISGFTCDWTAESFIEWAIEDIKKKVGDGKVILGLSGGVDSSVTAALLYKAIGDQLIPIFVDTGLLRKNEVAEVEDIFESAFGLKLNTVRAADLFLGKLKGVTDPEQKRKNHW